MVDFNLSSVGVNHYDFSGCKYGVCYSEDYVKEFIRILKEEFKGYGNYSEDILWFIDKMAGEKLI